jgi:hypothetical protein
MTTQMTEIDIRDHQFLQKKMLMDRFRSHFPDRSTRKLQFAFGMLKAIGGARSDASTFNIDQFKHSSIVFFKISLNPREVDEVFQILNRNGDGQLHVQDFIAGLQVRAPLSSRLTSE